MTADASTRPKTGLMIKIVLALSIVALGLSGFNTFMIVSGRTGSQAIVDQLRQAERARKEDVAAAERQRQEQERAASDAMRFR